MTWNVLPGVWETGLIGKAVTQNRQGVRGGQQGQVRSGPLCSMGQWTGKRESSGTSLKGALRTRISLPHESPWQSYSEGISKKPRDAPTENKRKHWIATKLRGQDHRITTPFSLSSLPPGTSYGRARSSSYWVGEELASKKSTTTPSVTTGFQTQRNADLGWREMVPVDANLHFVLFHWTRQLNYWMRLLLWIKWMGTLWDPG